MAEELHDRLSGDSTSTAPQRHWTFIIRSAPVLSKRAEPSLRERIDRAALGRWSDERFQAASVRNFDRLGKQALDELRQADIAPQAHRPDLHENIDVAVGAVIAARARAEQRSVGHPALPQSGFVFPKPCENGVPVHEVLIPYSNPLAPAARVPPANAALPQRPDFS
jgi:hypothetical protein